MVESAKKFLALLVALGGLALFLSAAIYFMNTDPGPLSLYDLVEHWTSYQQSVHDQPSIMHGSG